MKYQFTFKLVSKALLHVLIFISIYKKYSVGTYFIRFINVNCILFFRL